MITPQTLEKGSEHIGEQCALCKQPFTNGDLALECPICGAVHHHYCWEENGETCTTLGCPGHGAVGRESAAEGAAPEASTTPSDSVAQPVDPPVRPANGRSARMRPGSGRRSAVARGAAAPATAAPTTAIATPASRVTTWAQGCVYLAIAIAILVMGFSCFGLWAIADYILLEILEWNYRLEPQNAIWLATSLL